MVPKRAVTREQVRELDRIAIQEYGVSGLILMENAGRHCAVAAAEMLDGAEGRRVVVLCGAGNNGGDGFVVARHLSNWGADVHCYLLSEINSMLRRGNEASVNLEICLNMELPVTEVTAPEGLPAVSDACAHCDLIVDAMLGTGAHGSVREPYLSAVRTINESPAPVLAVDIPSGLDADEGEPLGVAVKAARTVTFAVAKIGLTKPAAGPYTGRVDVVEISIPRRVIEEKLLEWQTEVN